MVRKALTMLLESIGGYEVIAEATDGFEVIQYFKDGRIPQLPVLDISMPKMNGYDTAKYICKNYPQVNVLMLTMHDTDIMFIRLIEYGVKGILKKDSTHTEMEKALLLVANSQYYFSASDMHKFVYNTKECLSLRNIFNDAQIEFLTLCTTDMNYKQIADAMNMTESKIDHIRDNLFEKLEIKNRVGLAMFAVKNGLGEVNYLN